MAIHKVPCLPMDSSPMDQLVISYLPLLVIFPRMCSPGSIQNDQLHPGTEVSAILKIPTYVTHSHETSSKLIDFASAARSILQRSSNAVHVPVDKPPDELRAAVVKESLAGKAQFRPRKPGFEWH